MITSSIRCNAFVHFISITIMIWTGKGCVHIVNTLIETKRLVWSGKEVTSMSARRFWMMRGYLGWAGRRVGMLKDYVACFF